MSRNRGSKGISDFVRVLMALELEHYFRERAKSNQRLGGRGKGSAHLAEADRLDVRTEVAQAAGVSSGNVFKVKQILRDAIPGIREGLLTGEIESTAGAAWAKHSSGAQLRFLSDYRNEHGIRTTINRLLRKHGVRYPSICAGLREVQHGLTKLHTEPSLSSLKAALLTTIEKIDRIVSHCKVNSAA